jgi:hypothetical protein
MSPETLSQIFNLFVSTKGSRGTGLGLTVSRKILKEHHGDIRAESRLGEGSTFILEFPLLLAGDAPAGPHAPAGPRASGDDSAPEGDSDEDSDDDFGRGPSTMPGGGGTSQRTLPGGDRAPRDSGPRSQP